MIVWEISPVIHSEGVVRAKPRPKPFQCEECKMCFALSYELKKHNFRQHSEENPLKKHICTECQASFEREGRLDSHKNSIHLNVRPYKCQLCEKDFCGVETLKSHLKRIHGVAK